MADEWTLPCLSSNCWWYVLLCSAVHAGGMVCVHVACCCRLSLVACIGLALSTPISNTLWYALTNNFFRHFVIITWKTFRPSPNSLVSPPNKKIKFWMSSLVCFYCCNYSSISGAISLIFSSENQRKAAAAIQRKGNHWCISWIRFSQRDQGFLSCR